MNKGKVSIFKNNLDFECFIQKDKMGHTHRNSVQFKILGLFNSATYIHLTSRIENAYNLGINICKTRYMTQDHTVSISS